MKLNEILEPVPKKARDKKRLVRRFALKRKIKNDPASNIVTIWPWVGKL